MMSDRTDNNYMELFHAIYKQAVKDDYAFVRARIYEGLLKGKVDKRSAHEYIEKNSDAIKEQVCKDVYHEALSWGGNTRKMQKEHMGMLIAKYLDGYGGAHD